MDDPDTELDLLADGEGVEVDVDVAAELDMGDSDEEGVPETLALPLVLGELDTVTIGVSEANALEDAEGDEEMLVVPDAETVPLRVAKGDKELVVDPDVVFVDVGVGDPLGLEELDLDELEEGVLVGVIAKVLVAVIDCVDVLVTVTVLVVVDVGELVVDALVLGVFEVEAVVDVEALADDDDETVAPEVLDVLADAELETVPIEDALDKAVLAGEEEPDSDGEELADVLPDGDTDGVEDVVWEATEVGVAGGDALLVAVALADAVPELVSDTLGVTDPLGDAVGEDVIDFVATGDFDAIELVDGDLDEEEVFEFEADDVVVLDTFGVADEDLELVVVGVLAAVDVVERVDLIVGLDDGVTPEEEDAFGELLEDTEAVADRVTEVEAVLVLDTDAEGVEVGVVIILLVALLDTVDETVGKVEGELRGVADDVALAIDVALSEALAETLSVAAGDIVPWAEADDDRVARPVADPDALAKGEKVASDEEDGVVDAETDPDDDGLAELDTDGKTVNVDVTVAADVREGADDFDGAGLDVVDLVGIGEGVDDFDCVDVFVCDADLSGVLVLVTEGDSEADALLEGLAFELLDAIGDLDEVLETVDDFELSGDEDGDLDDVVVGVETALSVDDALSKGDGEELGVESDDLVEVVDGLDEIVA